jgi:hypothetical protein
MQLPLRSHYRSKSLELIDFSNQYFYDGQLTLLPDADHINPTEPPVSYHKVDGVWENNTNEIEAHEIVAMVMEMVKSNPEKEIGIVCFNSPQQMLILDLLDAAFSEHQIPFPDTLIVKNIENVQGDEKDIIIFSIGYAPDKKGKLHFHFGSLSVAGGENRLNVAITRAREKIIVVTSIWPEELLVEEAKNEGPKLLKKYLQYIKEIADGHFKPFVNTNNNTKTSWYLKDIVEAWGTEKFPDKQFMKDALPFADVSAHMENNKVGLILTDDELYRQNPSVKDLHASMLNLFEQKKWKHVRTYSRNYWQDQEKFFNEVAKFVSS